MGSAFTALLLCLAVPTSGQRKPPQAHSTKPKGPPVPQTKAQPPPWKPFNLYSLLPPAELRAELERRHLRGQRFPLLLESITRGLVAAPYLLSPLGEGQAPDPDPRFRLDAFDCTTFVETAIALSRCDDLDQIRETLDRIRYKGATQAFQKRRHLMTSQWIPGLIKAGYVEDITATVGGKRTQKMRVALTRRRWKKRRVARTLKLDLKEVPQGEFLLPYLEIETLKTLGSKIPSGTIINVVRANIYGYPDVITHQGIILRRPHSKVTLVRHASPVSKRVIDEALVYMLKRYSKPRKWPIVGMNLLRILDPHAPTKFAGKSPSTAP